MDSEPEDIIKERLAALGTLVEFGASMEWLLRRAFCSLVGSKFAAVVAGGQGADWLIGQCQALVDAHRELPDAARQEIKDALADCRKANEARNHLVHSVKTASGPDGSLLTLRSRLRSYKTTRKPWTLGEINAAGSALMLAGQNLSHAVGKAVGPEMEFIDEGLLWEDRQRQEDGK